ncbi:hypothetical protein [Microbacterium sp.]|uniref:hypothetical protein n=1 Tax=Microbacterium sp. TaxID=51671 RepID=UPI0028973D86|nr:hypothetical protein [Microbacterium sp.]
MTGSDDLEISSGGAVAVDTESLRAAAAQLRVLADGCERVRDGLVHAESVMVVQGGQFLIAPTREARDCAEAATAVADGLTMLADTYEYVELSARAEAARAGGDARLAAMLDRRRGELAGFDPGLPARAQEVSDAWRHGRDDALTDHLGRYAFLLGGGLGSFFVGSAYVGLIDRVGRGTPSAPLEGAPRRVELTPVREGRATAPASVTALARRIPSGDGRVRVERYRRPDGSREFAVYAAGTQQMLPGAEPFDMASNLELYTGARSTSYDAIAEALTDAGARPGATVNLVGYSQGAMAVTAVALSGTYEVPMLVTFGSPVQADVGEATLSVAVRHGDDLVSALAAGGLAAGAGAPGSFVAERTVQSSMTQDGLLVAPHMMGEYLETARALDDSTDPRMAAVRERLAGWGDAASVDVTVYAARE